MSFSLKQRETEGHELWAIAFYPKFIDVPTTRNTAGNSSKKSKNGSKNTTESSSQEESSVRCNYFATVGGRQANIYEYKSGGKGAGNNGSKEDWKFNLLHSYTSTHTGVEDFFSVTFAHRRSRQIADDDDNDDDDHEEQQYSRVICVGGAAKEILIIDIETGTLEAKLTGCIGPILDLKAICCECKTQQNVNLLCSAAGNELKLWNIDTNACIAVFADLYLIDPIELITVAWHPSGSKIVAAGGHSKNEQVRGIDDNNQNMFQIYIWNVLDSDRVHEAIIASSHVPPGSDNRSRFNSVNERFPASKHNDVHTNKIDCVSWFGDLILSKSIYDDIRMWKPLIPPSRIVNNRDTDTSSILEVQNFNYPGNDLYFLRFATSFTDSSSILAVGNSLGQVFVWDLEDDIDNNSPKILRTVSTSGKKPKKNKPGATHVIRGLAISPDGNTLVGCDSNGDVFRWEKQEVHQILDGLHS